MKEGTALNTEASVGPLLFALVQIPKECRHGRELAGGSSSLQRMPIYERIFRATRQLWRVTYFVYPLFLGRTVSHNYSRCVPNRTIQVKSKRFVRITNRTEKAFPASIVCSAPVLRKLPSSRIVNLPRAVDDQHSSDNTSGGYLSTPMLCENPTARKRHVLLMLGSTKSFFIDLNA